MRWNADQIRAFLGWILPRHAQLGGRTELRALGRGPRGGVWSAFVGPDDLDGIVEALAPLPGGPRPGFRDWPRCGEANLYFGLNPVKPDTVPPREASLFTRVSRATRDRDVLAYSMFVVDVDPERMPRDRAATDAEKAEALALATTIRGELRAANIEPLFADSGNGYHLLVPLVPVPGDGVPGAAREVHAILRALDGRFSTKAARVDTSVYNPSRILKLYGSLAMKGENTPEHPHRIASIDLSVIPEDVDVVARLAGRAVGRPKPPAPAATAPREPSRPAAPRPTTPWSEWRARALAALPLEAVYGDLLTGKLTNGWVQCRDPDSPSGDQRPSAGVADTAADFERGSFHSFRDGRTLSAFDYLIARGGAADFRAACARVAELSGVPLPGPGVVGQGALDRFRAAWASASDDGHRHAAVREAVAGTIHLPAIEQRQALDAIGELTGFASALLLRTLAEVRKADRRANTQARVQAAVPRGRPVVDYVQNRDTVEALFDALIAAVKPVTRFFRQERDLVFVRRGIGPMVISERNVAGLLSALVEIRFLHEGDDGQELLRYDVLPSDLSRAFVYSPRVAASLPVLVAYTRTPLFDTAGRLVGQPGWHEDSGIFYDGSPIEPSEGTATLDAGLASFCWKEPTDRINFLGALLTTVTMPMWTRGHPFVAINGNKPGVGKSTLARVLGILSEGGAEPSTVSWCSDEAEFEKHIATRVEAGDRVIIIDNAKTAKPIESPILERCITDTRLNFRRLGSNTSIGRAQNDVLFCITMNLVQMGADLRRRALPVNLEMEVDVRDARFDHDDVIGWVQAHREAALAELLGLVQRWMDAERPLAEVPARHSTGHRWAATIDGILAHAGLPGFLSNFEASEHAFDPKYAVMLEIVRGFAGREPMTAGAWAGVLGEVLEDRFKDRSGGARSERARATIVGALFAEYSDARFEVDGVNYRLAREWPEGLGRPAVWGVTR
jgi:hypothetical protein